MDGLLLTADRLLAGDLVGATATGWHHGASLACGPPWRPASTTCSAPPVPGPSPTTNRAKPLCLGCYVAADTARHTKTVWSHLCLGCHCYEMGPTREQVLTWRAEAGEPARQLLS
ncbi:hypothetical protein [Streptomyces sp. 8L]|uniref:hypothetical protein n=1 Tax=Streptomyces sp. 8L TaxID=2877242 RepID=UPI001CD4BD9B|nr:hypothetical protein [Streptomyces sp. 8L]MCA1223640.1 hypothetical protein [Streptomyces sp. 8L]